MSSFSCPIVKIKKVGRVPNSDNLSICHIFNFPVIFRTGDFKEDDVAVYIPSDSMVPLSRPEFKFLDSGKNRTHERVRAKKLRGVYSDGLLIPLPSNSPDTRIGAELAEFLGVVKYEEPEKNLPTSGDARKAPDWFITYTDIENIRRYPNILQAGEEVVITEKTHGCLHEDVNILLEDGNYKPIKDIRPGERIKSYSRATGQFLSAPVKRNIVQPPAKDLKWLKLNLESGRSITLTADHRILTQRGWIIAEKLTVEDNIISI